MRSSSTSGATGPTDGAPGPTVDVIAGAAGLAESLFVVFGPVVRSTSADGTGTRTTGTISGIDYLFGVPGTPFELSA